MSYTPQPGTIPSRVVEYLMAQAKLRRQWVPGAELSEHVGQAHVSPYLKVAINEGAVLRRPSPLDGRLSEYALGNGVPSARPHDLEPDEPLHSMPQRPSTALVSSANPFQSTTGGPKVSRIDPEKLTISNDPMPAHRASPNKYGEIFSRLKPGQCIVCEPPHAAKLATALKKHVAQSGQNHMVRSTSRFDDGRGRVWLIAGPAAKVKRAA